MKVKAVIIILLFFLLNTAIHTGIIDTKHNLSSSGPGEIKAVSETEICVFCHVPHNSYPKTPLWGHVLSEVKNYKIYKSSQSVSSTGREFVQPDGASRLCLSCHDGTVAIGAVLGREKIEITSGKEVFGPGMSGYIGTDLSGDHPISISITDSKVSERNSRGLSRLKSVKEMKSDPDGVKLDENNKVQCTTCHDAHSDDNFNSSGIHFWRKKDFSSLCEVCHVM